MRPEMIRCRQQARQKRQVQKNDNEGLGSVLLYRHGTYCAVKLLTEKLKG